jgi:hypothetical protein
MQYPNPTKGTAVKNPRVTVKIEQRPGSAIVPVKIPAIGLEVTAEEATPDELENLTTRATACASTLADQLGMLPSRITQDRES